MDISIALIIFSSVAVVTCLFIITYFLLIKRENRLIDMSIGLLFLSIALRISKSIFYYILIDMSSFGVALGYLGYASIGPFLLIYFNISKDDTYKLKMRDALHFLFSLVGFLVIFLLDDFRNTFYLAANVQLTGYLIYIGIKHIGNNESKYSKWHRTLFYGVVSLLLVFTLQFFMGGLQSYTVGTALASLIVYVLFFIALKTPTVIQKHTHTHLPEDLLKKIQTAIERDKIYRQQAITLAQFSQAIHSPTYLVSKATKSIYNKSFPEVINGFRIKEITQKLSEPDNDHYKIEGLAYDVGFNTSSAFYNAFKKETSMSPREYQKKFSDVLS
jgi:AraC-like DNA-binding protein